MCLIPYTVLVSLSLWQDKRENGSLRALRLPTKTFAMATVTMMTTVVVLVLVLLALVSSSPRGSGVFALDPPRAQAQQLKDANQLASLASSIEASTVLQQQQEEVKNGVGVGVGLGLPPSINSATANTIAPSLRPIALTLPEASKNYGQTDGVATIETSSEEPNKWAYLSNDGLGAFAKRMEASYPEWCKAYSIGESVQGNKLWVLTVSKEASKFSSPDYTPSSLSPSFLYVGGMHGNEPLGRQLMVYLGEELCSGAGKFQDPYIDEILASGSVHLLFAMNPDGFDMKQRENAHRVDLNRNFPDPILRRGDLNLTGQEEPESIALTKYVERLGDSLTGSTLLHEGALVVNYPLDGAASGVWEIKPNPSPDDKLYRYLSQRYIDVQPELQSNPEFPEGKVQGSSWYPVYGGLQDWLYLRHNIYTTTVEMNDQKWPDQSQLQRLWMQHRRSMYEYLRAHISQGLTVQVDFPPGSPEEEVLVTMVTPQMGRPVSFKSRTSHGVHYPVPPGNYSVSVSWLNTGQMQSLSVSVGEGSRTTLRVEKPAESSLEDPLALVEEKPAEASSSASVVDDNHSFGSPHESWDVECLSDGTVAEAREEKPTEAEREYGIQQGCGIGLNSSAS